MSHLALALVLAAAAFALFLGAFAFALVRGLTRTAPWKPQRRGWLQLGLGVVPFAVATALFLVGFRGYVDAAVAPGDAVEIVASAADGAWTFTYPTGQTGSELKVPAGRPVHLTVKTTAPLQRLDLPALGRGTEATPDADGSLWFVASAAGAELAVGGDAPAAPSTQLTIIEPNAWDDFLDDGSKLPPAEYGKKLYAKSMCQTCHSTDGRVITGPSFKGLFGKHETLADGSSVVVDDAYIKESILTPTAKVVKGFQPVMPPFQGQLGDKQIAALTAFIKSVQK